MDDYHLSHITKLKKFKIAVKVQLKQIQKLGVGFP
jgi:hypothetical protein